MKMQDELDRRHEKAITATQALSLIVEDTSLDYVLMRRKILIALMQCLVAWEEVQPTSSVILELEHQALKGR